MKSSKLAVFIITTLMILFIAIYLLGYIALAYTESVAYLFVAIVPLALIIAMIVIAVGRFKEIKEEKEDDLSKY